MEVSRNSAEQVVSEAKPWIVRLARIGHAAKGLVYCIVGILAVRAAIGAGGETAGAREALTNLVTKPFGEVLLGVMGAGLFGYATWRMIQAFRDTEGKGTEAKGIAVRAGYVISGLVHYGLGWAAIQLATGWGRGGSSDKPDDWTAFVMAKPFGRWLVMAIGVGIVGYGLYQIYRAIKTEFVECLRKGEMSQREYSWALKSGRAGLSARGVVFMIIGWFLVRAGLRSDPQQAGGLGEALVELASHAYGPWLLGLVALGLIAYGVYCFVLAKYRRIAV